MIHEPPTPLERVAVWAGGATLFSMTALAFAQPFLGFELDCFPRLEGSEKGMLGLGFVAGVVAVVATAVTALGGLGWEKRLSVHFLVAFFALALSAPLAIFATANAKVGCPSGRRIDRSDRWEKSTRKPEALTHALSPDVETIDARALR